MPFIPRERESSSSGSQFWKRPEYRSSLLGNLQKFLLGTEHCVVT